MLCFLLVILSPNVNKNPKLTIETVYIRLCLFGKVLNNLLYSIKECSIIMIIQCIEKINIIVYGMILRHILSVGLNCGSF